MSIFDGIRRSGFHRGPQRIVAGICGGLARQLRMNVWLVRVLVLLAFLLPVVGLGLYLVVWIITPDERGSIPLERALRRR